MAVTTLRKVSIRRQGFAGQQVRLSTIDCPALNNWPHPSVFLGTANPQGKVVIEAAPGPYDLNVLTEAGWMAPKGLEQFVVGTEEGS
jgi:hypothetical protein